MAAYKFERLIDDSHTVVLPPEVPTGWVEISVVPKHEPPTPSEHYFAVLDDILSKPARNPLTPQQIHEYIRSERDSWE